MMNSISKTGRPQVRESDENLVEIDQDNQSHYIKDKRPYPND